MPTVLITGANRGLGLEFVRQYLGDGWDVIACCRSPESSAELSDLAQGSLDIRQLDVTDFEAVDALASELSGRAIDVLINNAGIMGAFPLEENLSRQEFGSVDYDHWAEIERINTFAPVKLAEAFVEHLAASEQKKLVNISTSVASMSTMNAPAIAYSASKTALNRAMTIIADPLKERGISVALLCPGYAKTRMDFAGYATVDPADSIKGMRKVIANFTLEASGSFVRFDGEAIGW